MTRLALAIVFVALSACGRTPVVYRDTWEPASVELQGGAPMLMRAALLARPEDMAALRAAVGRVRVALTDWALDARRSAAGRARALARAPAAPGAACEVTSR